MPSMVKFFKQLNLGLYFSKPQIKHLQAFIVAMMLKGFGGKLTDVAELAIHTHRTSVGRFLDSDAWDEAYLIRAIREHVIALMWSESKRTKRPIYVIADDTICEKAIPSSRVKSPIYGCGFYKSHLKNKMVYGQQFVTVMLRCGNMVLPLETVLYEKQSDKSALTKSKISIVRDIINSLPKPPHGGYVLSDSWYSCTSLFDAAKEKGYHYVGAIKSNRLIFPRGFRKKGIKIGDYARSLQQSDFDLVTVDRRSYHVYTYLGKINGQRKVKIIVTWPKGSFGVPQAMKAFITTDIEMNPKQLIAHYMKRWPIEVFFREANRYLGMKQCQARSKKAVVRYQYIVMLAYIFCGLAVSRGKIVFGAKRRENKKAIEQFKVTWLVEQVRKNVDLADILKAYKLA